ncbi:MAG: YD repeat-containing protein [Candidatus Kentron sp. G]|nr:MAG: YD repeat-containing protein [Candidatus Kentron sp. G]VFM96587.1 MAG: YD repeat-containing protein [Candidatus Kentron sp. G]VFM98544.1 MAG: YD repeat-containing protein [Candidatus Kentron sp. G]
MAYDGNGNLTHLTDANAAAGAQPENSPKNSEGATRYHQYDQLGRRMRTLDANDGETAYQYDLLGNLTALTDPRGARHQLRVRRSRPSRRDHRSPYVWFPRALRGNPLTARLRRIH